MLEARQHRAEHLDLDVELLAAFAAAGVVGTLAGQNLPARELVAPGEVRARRSPRDEDATGRIEDHGDGDFSWDRVVRHGRGEGPRARAASRSAGRLPSCAT